MDKRDQLILESLEQEQKEMKSIRVYPSDFELIKKHFRTMQRFVDFCIEKEFYVDEGDDV